MTTLTAEIPQTLSTVEELEELLSRPQQGLIDDLAQLEGDIIVVGVGGKVGPTLARMAKRAAPDKRVYGVARFSDADVKRRLEEWGVECITCDLTDQQSVQQLPQVANVIYMAGKKFGTAGDEPYTWAMNTVVPTYVADHFKNSRIVAFSTLCVYPFADINTKGCDESVTPTPVGEYPNSCVGRERVFQYFSKTHGTLGRVCRLNYAIDLRYGVLHDIALQVKNNEAIDLSTGWANVIWQGDSTNHILRCLNQCEAGAPPINIGEVQPASVRYVAEEFAKHFGVKATFINQEGDQLWHNNCDLAQSLFGDTTVDLDTMIRWNAEWIKAEGSVYDKPTHFAERGGTF